MPSYHVGLYISIKPIFGIIYAGHIYSCPKQRLCRHYVGSPKTSLFDWFFWPVLAFLNMPIHSVAQLESQVYCEHCDIRVFFQEYRKKGLFSIANLVYCVGEM